ncbi:hypothetical protein L6R53_24580 [Myxococcota bacterium]|nr:hypothetical protein [Myxococcota bacterium]
MTLSWPDDPAWQALAAPLRPVLDAALATLSLRPSVLPAIVPGLPGGPRPTPGALPLDPALLGPGPWHPDDLDWARAHPHLAPLALDRWRRAAGLILEGLALRALDERVGAPLPMAWWTLGPAAEAVDRADPSLGWLWPELAMLLAHPEEGLAAAPRRAAWLVRWFRQTGRPWVPGERPTLTDPDWAAFGAWLDDLARGPGGSCPVPLERGPARALPPAVAAPLSFQRLAVEAGPAGAWARWPGGARGLAGREQADLRVGSVAGGAPALEVEAALPLGTWRLVGGTAGERPGAARGIELHLREDGAIDLVFADAFAGPPTPSLLALGKQLGVSGTGRGRYRVVQAEGPGRGTLVFDALQPDLLSVHPRFSGRFSLPAEAVLGPVHKALEAMVGVPWQFRQEGVELVLSAEVWGMATVLRLAAGAEE